MFIERIINNNAVFSRDEKGQEVVVAGRGIAFRRKVGMQIDTGEIEKLFVLKNFGEMTRIEEIFREIPIECIEVGNEIICYGKEHLDRRLNESIYLTLSDHIHTSVKRFREGISLHNQMLWDIKRFYKDEFEVGMKSLELIKDRLGIELPIDEAGFIAFHFVNASMDEEMGITYQMTNMIQEISNIVKYNFNVEFDTDSVYYHRFITHLKFFSHRLVKKQMHDSNTDTIFLQLIKTNYMNSFECVMKISKFLQEKYDYIISSDETLYLTIHIDRLIYKS